MGECFPGPVGRNLQSDHSRAVFDVTLSCRAVALAGGGRNLYWYLRVWSSSSLRAIVFRALDVTGRQAGREGGGATFFNVIIMHLRLPVWENSMTVINFSFG